MTQRLEVVDLIQRMIRNECVNDGSVESGHERRSVDLLRSELDGSGVDFEVYEPTPGRASLVGRIEGSEPGAPSMCWLGHTDVVPANPDTWSRDPFGGELVDGEVWGRGAVDMLNITASMSVAFDRLARSGFRPKGTLVLAAVADEEALGSHGAGWLAQHETDAVKCDYLITESGGIPLEGPEGRRLPVMVGEKGSCWCQLRIHGEAGHASQPLRTDNALVTAAAVVGRLAAFRPTAQIHNAWRQFIDGMGWPPEIARLLLDPVDIEELLDVMPDVGMARQAHACTHITMAPTILHGGTKINVIPDTVDLEVDIRTLPGQSEAEVRSLVAEAIGPELWAKVEILFMIDDPATSSPIDTPLWAAMERVSDGFHPGAPLVPFFSVGATDARFFRRLGTTAYGYGMFSERLSFEQFAVMFHGDDERVDVESLEMSTAMFEHLAREFLG
ncbi:MAG: M20/M25/M40 family metallo-hydrolase [Acidimicrobiales bacterium]|jgi:acetylornithine deacetylase/succinyl-diaminopimelate desuccinylase-like protein